MKTQLHPDVLARRGRVDGYVYTQRRGTNLARSFVTPLNPRSDIQQDVRGSFGTASQVWSTVSASEASLWDAFATNYTRINNVGVYVTLTGIEACVMINAYRLMHGAAVTTTPPTYAPINDIVSLDDIEKLTGIADMTIKIGEGTIPANSLAVVRLTPDIPNPVYPSQDGDYRMPTLITDDAIIDIGTAAASIYTLTITNANLREPWKSVTGGAKLRLHIRMLTDEYCPPTLPTEAYNVSGIVTLV